jgi:phosphatidylinositol glycan class M
MYGQQFLHETFLYHGSRKDPRHSFSIYYYPVYLDFMEWPATATHATSGCTGAVNAATASSTHSSAEALQQSLVQWLQWLPDVQAGQFALLPQLALVVAVALIAHQNQPICWLLQTIAFVAFNKVSTAQYFVWYYSLLPIALQCMPWPLPKQLKTAGIMWVGTQLNWLFWAYLLEFEGLGVHLMLWFAGVLFLIANCACLWVLLGCISPSSHRIKVA